MQRTPRARPRLALLLAALLPALSGCAALQQMAALRQVDFSLDRISGLSLAGVDLSRIQRYEDLGLMDAARIAAAFTAGELPLGLTLHVRADNPEGNGQARMTALDWTLLLQEKETVSGGIPQAVLIPAAGTADIPLAISLDLLEFFQGSGQDLVNLALSLAGGEAPATTVSLRATPTIETPFGPIRYPQPITIATRTVER
ncbi:MAG: LEA/WHy family protein [Longimicrobiales bacterium]